MVGTMPLLSAFIRTARMIRHTPGLAEGLPADDEVRLDVPDARLAPALAAARRGDHVPAARLLAGTREAGEWESRDRYTAGLAALARTDGAWLARWRRSAPYSADLLLVDAERAVVRHSGSAAPPDDTAVAIAAAAEAAPRDPVPWRIALDHARDLRVGRASFDGLWAEAVSRSPLHYGCHVAALRYLAAAGPTGAEGRSHAGCFDFAERAARDALPESLVRALPVRTAYAWLEDPGAAPVPRERLDAAADTALALSAGYAPGDPWPTEVRNLLAYVLVRLGRWQDALGQLRLIGPHATSFPWARLSGDPLGQFLELRDGVRLEVASRIPLWAPRRGQGGRSRRGDH